MAKKEEDQEFLEFIVKSIVDNPKDIKIERTIDERGVLLSLKANPADMGQLIGKGGSTARAIRTLLRIVGMKQNAWVNLRIVEPEGSTRAPRAPQAQAPQAETAQTKNVDQVVDELKL